MNKKKVIQELTNLLAKSSRHKIGSLVNSDEIYAEKYAKDSEILLKEAQKTALKENWNIYDKSIIKNKLKRKLKAELEKKDFLNEKKFDMMEEEINKKDDLVINLQCLEKETLVYIPEKAEMMKHDLEVKPISFFYIKTQYNILYPK